MDEIELMQEVVQPTQRRRHSKEFKAQVIRAAMQPNVSIAAVALHYRLNANMVRSWVAAQEERDAAEVARKSMSVPSAEFVPLHLDAPGVAGGATEIHIEVRRGAATVTHRVRRRHVVSRSSPRKSPPTVWLTLLRLEVNLSTSCPRGAKCLEPPGDSFNLYYA